MLDCSWHLSPNQLLVNKNEVHIWRSTLNLPREKVEILAQTLSADELKRAQKFHFEQDRQRFMVARGLLRTILGNYLAVPAALLEFNYGQHGKPAIRDTFLRFNLSHSENLVLYAITRDRNLGIDLEFIRPMKEAEQIAKRYFSLQENAIFQALSPDEKPAGFFYHWTRKEAYLKAVGDGLAAGNNDFDDTVATKSDRAKQWFLRSFAPAPNYLATVAVEGNDWNILYLEPFTLL
ncbi:MAG: 4'-phosphopantetheinyl transferase superfamily protein [Chroococcus sp. CMT-3BRIN-NPC107]|jgi:4'-phosphopantetheinyl transferase|nr:4'-phosphopantetheinyl transferase superfamily protein [Chroococcus sp. CMT-3BRIN-NPC107]